MQRYTRAPSAWCASIGARAAMPPSCGHACGLARKYPTTNRTSAVRAVCFNDHCRRVCQNRLWGAILLAWVKT